MELEIDNIVKILKNKGNRRNNWRIDHLRFQKSFTSMKLSVSSTLNMSNINTFKDLNDYSFNSIEKNENDVKRSANSNKNIKSKTLRNKFFLKIMDNCPSHFMSLDKRVSLIPQKNKSVMYECVTELVKSKKIKSLPELIITRSFKEKASSKSIENNCLPRIKITHLSKDSDLFLQNAICNMDLSSSNKTIRYAQQLSKVIRYYIDMFWAKENVLEEIPKYLSSHKAKLENFKQLNGRRQHYVNRCNTEKTLSLIKERVTDVSINSRDIPKSIKYNNNLHHTKSISSSSFDLMNSISKNNTISFEDKKCKSDLCIMDNCGMEKKFETPKGKDNVLLKNISLITSSLELYKEYSKNENNEAFKNGNENQIKKSNNNTKQNNGVDRILINYKDNKSRVECLKNNERKVNTLRKKVLTQTKRSHQYFDKTIRSFDKYESLQDEQYKKAWKVEF